MMLLLDLEPGPWELTGALNVSDAAAQFGGYAAWPPRSRWVDGTCHIQLLMGSPSYKSYDTIVQCSTSKSLRHVLR